MQHDVLVLPSGKEGKRFKFEFKDRSGKPQSITFVTEGDVDLKTYLQDLAKEITDYVRK